MSFFWWPAEKGFDVKRNDLLWAICLNDKSNYVKEIIDAYTKEKLAPKPWLNKESTLYNLINRKSFKEVGVDYIPKWLDDNLLKIK
jgi:hypothetical protein